jgi:hypothetical protein
MKHAEPTHIRNWTDGLDTSQSDGITPFHSDQKPSSFTIFVPCSITPGVRPFFTRMIWTQIVHNGDVSSTLTTPAIDATAKFFIGEMCFSPETTVLITCIWCGA